jgi:hypothetical protein
MKPTKRITRERAEADRVRKIAADAQAALFPTLNRKEKA